MNRILFFTLVICLVNLLTFLFVPDSSAYTFNFDLFLKQPWRIFTFQFFHVNIFHLLENVIGFIFIGLIATELEIDFKSFIFIYFLAQFVTILPILINLPFVTVAGNSTGIYGALALCLIKARKLISAKITVPIVIVSIFSLSIFNSILCGVCFMSFFKSDLFHFSSFLLGVILSFTTKSKYFNSRIKIHHIKKFE